MKGPFTCCAHRLELCLGVGCVGGGALGIAGIVVGLSRFFSNEKIFGFGVTLQLGGRDGNVDGA